MGMPYTKVHFLNQIFATYAQSKTNIVHVNAQRTGLMHCVQVLKTDCTTFTYRTIRSSFATYTKY